MHHHTQPDPPFPLQRNPGCSKLSQASYSSGSHKVVPSRFPKDLPSAVGSMVSRGPPAARVLRAYSATNCTAQGLCLSSAAQIQVADRGGDAKSPFCQMKATLGRAYLLQRTTLQQAHLHFSSNTSHPKLHLSIATRRPDPQHTSAQDCLSCWNPPSQVSDTSWYREDT